MGTKTALIWSLRINGNCPVGLLIKPFLSGHQHLNLLDSIRWSHPSGWSSSVWKGTKAGFCVMWVVLYAGKLARISPSSENSLGLSCAYTIEFCQQSCTGQEVWRGVIPELYSCAGTALRHGGTVYIRWGMHSFSSLLGSCRPELCCYSPICLVAFQQGYVGVPLLLECCWGRSSCEFLTGCFQNLLK